MAFLILILSIWAVLWIISCFTFKNFLSSHKTKARIAFAIAYFFIGLTHLLTPEKLEYMVEGILPFPRFLVIASGLMEMGLAIMLLVPKYQRIAGWLIIGLLILVFPANVNVAVNNLPAPGGLPAKPWYTWSRLLFQPLYMLWVWWSAIKK